MEKKVEKREMERKEKREMEGWKGEGRSVRKSLSLITKRRQIFWRFR